MSSMDTQQPYLKQNILQMGTESRSIRGHGNRRPQLTASIPFLGVGIRIEYQVGGAWKRVIVLILGRATCPLGPHRELGDICWLRSVNFLVIRRLQNSYILRGVENISLSSRLEENKLLWNLGTKKRCIIS